MSLFVGGLRHDRQRFSSQTASVHTSSMILAVAGF
jgi:Ca2+/H+ antiporter